MKNKIPGQIVSVRLGPEEIKKVEELRNAQIAKPSLSEMVRALINKGLNALDQGEATQK